MELLISELMEDYIDNDFYPANFAVPDVSVERIRQLTVKKLRSAQAVPFKRSHKLGRTLLIAAAITALLALTVFAVYQIAFRDVLVGEPYGTENVQGEAAIQPWERVDVSVNGIAGSPEYQAYAEWTEWNDAWWAENPDPWTPLGVDDTYFETAENYAWIYQAWFTEQADKLDEITAKYGLTLHTLSTPVNTEEELCELLGVDDIWQNEFSTDHGTVFENGAFALSTALEEDMYVYLNVNADGSFSTLAMSIVPEYREWSYVTADGTAVTLAMADSSAYPDTVADPINAFLVTRFEEAAITVSFTGIETQAEAEAAADRLNLAGLSTLFASDADRSGIPAAVAEYKAAYEAERAQANAEMEQAAAQMQAELAQYDAQHSQEEWNALILKELGDYELPVTLPEQYLMRRVIINAPSSKAVSGYPEETPNEYGVTYYYADELDEQSDPTYIFRYTRQWTDESHTESVTRELFEAEKAKANELGALESVRIGDQEVYISTEPYVGTNIQWYDEARDLHFTIADMHKLNDPDIFPEEQMLALAANFIESLDTK